MINFLLISLAILSLSIIFLTINKKPDRGHKLTDIHIKRIDGTDKLILILIVLYVFNCSFLYAIQ